MDCTSIHPESYSIANDVLDQVGVSIEEFFAREIAYGKARAVDAAVETAAIETAAIAAPAVEAVAVEIPTGEIPTGEIPTGEIPTGETPTGETPTGETPTGETSASPEVSEQTEEEATASKTSEDVSETEKSETEKSETEKSETEKSETEKSETEKSETEKSEAEAELAALQAEREKRSANRKELLKKINELDVQALADQHVAGRLLVRDILLALKRPQWDPRDKVNKPIFRRGIIKVDDLKSEMQLDAQVVNVVDFGVFVDIGLGESSLVHVSQLSNHFIKDPHRFFSVGDVLKVWVSEIDAERRRVKLTAIRPGSKKAFGPSG